MGIDSENENGSGNALAAGGDNDAITDNAAVDSGDTTARATRKGMSRPAALALFAALAVALVVIDQATKALMRSMLAAPGATAPGIPGIFEFKLIYNEGAAFGVFAGAQAIFIVIAFVITAGLVAYIALTRNRRGTVVVAMSLVSAGAIGNVIDRIVFGRVTDFISLTFMDFAVFNIADSCITVGCVALALCAIFVRDDGLRDGED